MSDVNLHMGRMPPLVVPGPHGPLYNPVFWVPELVGLKALGLTRMPLLWVPSFFVITTAAQEQSRERVAARSPAAAVLADDVHFRECLIQQVAIHGELIVRSSAFRETLDERGRYDSHRTQPIAEAVFDAIDKVWSASQGASMGVVVQAYVKPLLSGHLSNERRVSRTENDWVFEFNNTVRSFRLRAPSFDDVVENELRCDSTDELDAALRRLATFSLKWSSRIHYEWVWTGAELLVVQADREDIKIGAPPKYLWPYDPPSQKLSDLKVLRELDDVTSAWKKLATSRLMRDLGLPSIPQYVLESTDELRRLASGERSADLQADLAKLLRWPIVIRTDKQADFELVLPRTDTIGTVEQAFSFLVDVCGDYVERGVEFSQFCFILHHFIASRACALALATPDDARVRIDSTWGVPEGLRYYPHDSFEVTLVGDSSCSATEEAPIQEHVRCKTNYIDTAASGDWVTATGGPPLDWTPSIPNDTIREIADQAHRVAVHVQSTVQVMFFVGVDSADGSVLPWVYTREKNAGYESASLRLSGRRLFVATAADLSRLETRIAGVGALTNSTIVVRPDPSTMRSNDFLDNVATFALTHNLSVELEGSVLSHNYYLLKRAGVRIRPVDPFDPKPVVQRFGKLVRDAIPGKIEGHGEIAQTTRASRSELLTLLRAKAVEEALELQNAVSLDDSIEELADLFEVIRSLATNLDLSIDDVIRTAEEKRSKRGGFDDGVVLHETRERPLLDALPGYPRARGAKSTAKRRPLFEDGAITIPLVPPARTEAGIHTRLTLNDPTVEVTIDYDEKDVRVSIRSHVEGTPAEPDDQMTLFTTRSYEKS